MPSISVEEVKGVIAKAIESNNPIADSSWVVKNINVDNFEELLLEAGVII